jgi:CheY-like chemotaxis protein
MTHYLGAAKSGESARAEIEVHQSELDLVFLDLSIPHSESSSRIDNNVGFELLEWIHTSVNRQRNRPLRVIIVSGQYDLTGIPDQKLRSGYDGTLIGIVKKDELKPELGRVIAKLASDPTLEAMVRLELSDIVPDYQTLYSAETSALDKSKAAKVIACKLLTNDGDYRENRLGICHFGDDLSGAIRQVIEKRFTGPEGKKPYVDKKHLAANQKWGDFIWRGTMLEHLYGINNYRNRLEHLPQNPYVEDAPAEWLIPPKVSKHFSEGNDVVPIIRSQVKSLLEWYLPWHEQVFLPWQKSQQNKAGGKPR